MSLTSVISSPLLHAHLNLKVNVSSIVNFVFVSVSVSVPTQRHLIVILGDTRPSTLKSPFLLNQSIPNRSPAENSDQNRNFKMQTLIYALGLSLSTLLLIATTTTPVAGVELRFACSNGTFGPTAQLREKLKNCHNPEVYGAAEGKKDPKCAAYCFTEAVNGLKDGVPDKAGFEELIESEFPESERKTALGLLELCFKQHGTVNLEDEKCVEIAAFSACATSLIKKTACA